MGGLSQSDRAWGDLPPLAKHGQIPRSIYDLTYSDLEDRLVANGVRPLHAKSLWRALYQRLETEIVQHSDILPPLRRWLDKHLNTDLTLDTPAVTECIGSADGYTKKLLLRLAGHQEIETVIMGYPRRFTACISTQAGCAMGCVFCATGQMGFVRNLRAGEMVAQVLHAQRQLRSQGESGLRNVVLMGMGEPLANYDAVIQALRIISNTRGTNIGTARITISTVGVVPGIIRLAEEGQPYNLAVSLHATTDAERSALVPVNHRWPLAALIGACRTYSATTGRRVFFGWTLIEDQNDSRDHARRLAELIRGLDAHVNLIQLNPTRDFDGRSSGLNAAVAFRTVLQEAGFACTIRQRRGIDVAAGCGQLRSAQTVSR